MSWALMKNGCGCCSVWEELLDDQNDPVEAEVHLIHGSGAPLEASALQSPLARC